MKEHLENFLWEHIGHNSVCHLTPRDVINFMVEEKMIRSPKQAWRTLEKWSKIGIYDYSNALDLGWKCV